MIPENVTLVHATNGSRERHHILKSTEYIHVVLTHGARKVIVCEVLMLGMSVGHPTGGRGTQAHLSSFLRMRVEQNSLPAEPTARWASPAAWHTR